MNEKNLSTVNSQMQGNQFPVVDVLIPAYNEEQSIGKVIAEIPDFVRHIVVVNNASTDNTRAAAENAGAIVLDEPQMGYGKACLTGMAWISKQEVRPDILVFLDGDFSDFPAQMANLIQPIQDGKADLVIGSRALGKRERGSMTIPQRFGNWLATRLMDYLYGVKFTDLGPFRAARWAKLSILGMEDQNYGWTIEMQIKAAKAGWKLAEIPVDYRRRIGVSKVSGTVKGVIGAGYKILWTIWRYR
ncbi:Glycosyltransferase [Mariniradius saccharolyticus AK6]|uniref:Glycosyltransferase n=2 Tax=Mariniradius TaxID=1245590 RepID=M7XB25_9BACT|nr:Glycosyltransferase [Mariniradius saccharolyticus AK6]